MRTKAIASIVKPRLNHYFYSRRSTHTKFVCASVRSPSQRYATSFPPGFATLYSKHAMFSARGRGSASSQ